MTETMQQIINDCKLRNITQRELSKRSGITENSISRYFKDQRTPDMNNVEKMAAALGLRVALVLRGNENG